jgi:hypothetical protein
MADRGIGGDHGAGVVECQREELGGLIEIAAQILFDRLKILPIHAAG